MLNVVFHFNNHTIAFDRPFGKESASNISTDLQTFKRSGYNSRTAVVAGVASACGVAYGVGE